MPEERWSPRSVRGAGVELRAIANEDIEFLRLAEVSLIGPSWRHRGATVSPEQFRATLWAGVLAQVLVVRTNDEAPVGLATLYNADLSAGISYFAAASFRPEIPERAFVRGLGLFLDYAFDNWPFRKLIMEVAEFNFPKIESLVGGLIEVEGRILDRYWAGGRLWDEVFTSISRTSWEAYAESRRRRWTGGSRSEG